MIINDEKFRKECLYRHYVNMDRAKALTVYGELTTKESKRKFKKRVNYAHGYDLI